MSDVVAVRRLEGHGWICGADRGDLRSHREHLVRSDECAPLILDDVTIHSDPVRKRALLDLLLQMSEQRQIILFAQEDEVRQWAEMTLQPPAHSFQLLDGAVVPH